MESVTQARSTRKSAVVEAAEQDEISKPANGGADIVTASFNTRLRETLTSLEDGQYIDIRTRNERQQVSNLVGQLQKKLGVKFETAVLRKRSEDPEGKIAIRIKRIGAVAVTPPTE